MHDEFEQITGIRLSDKLGEGATSVVYKGEVIRTRTGLKRNEYVAVKILKFLPEGKPGERLKTEIETGKTIKSKYVAKYIDHGDIVIGLTKTIYILIEYVEGQALLTYIKSVFNTEKNIESKLLDLLNKILIGLADLHSNGIIHRDIQPNNIIVRENGDPIIIDLGVSKHIGNPPITSVWEEIGTRRYWPPELMSEEKNKWHFSSDIFSLGSCLVHMITGKYIFSEKKNYPHFFNTLIAYQESNKVSIPELQDIPDTLGFLKQLLMLMLCPCLLDRPQASELIEMINGNRVLPQTRSSGKFPITEFLFQLEDDIELAVLNELACGYKNGKLFSLTDIIGSSDNTRVGDFYKSDSFMHIIGGWGLIRQVDPTQVFVTYDQDDQWFHDDVEFEPCETCVLINNYLQENPRVWRKINDARIDIYSRLKQGKLRKTGIELFKHVISGQNHFIDPHNTDWVFKIAIREYELVDSYLDVDLTTYPRWTSHGGIRGFRGVNS